MRRRVEPFACAPGMRLEAHEKVSKLQFEALNDRFARMEALLERLERRLWLAVYGVAGAILAQAFEGFLSVAP
ncbi:GTA head formation protein, RCAP_rcc01685 family [Sagittula sp. SSi028]|uniref:GTA head formation protein, RCAP_rcc01685 family n=1 Tax=Sagittula sp. SSi028 TaxID=3400636 RepID=UPI003AF9439E